MACGKIFEGGAQGPRRILTGFPELGMRRRVWVWRASGRANNLLVSIGHPRTGRPCDWLARHMGDSGQEGAHGTDIVSYDINSLSQNPLRRVFLSGSRRIKLQSSEKLHFSSSPFNPMSSTAFSHGVGTWHGIQRARCTWPEGPEGPGSLWSMRSLQQSLGLLMSVPPSLQASEDGSWRGPLLCP